MGLYYALPAFASIFMGAVIAAFLTGIFGNRLASLRRALFFSVSKFCLLIFLATYFSFYDYSVIIMFIGYYLLFAWIYRVKSIVRGIRFLIFSTAFSMSSRLVLMGPLVDFAGTFLY